MADDNAHIRPLHRASPKKLSRRQFIAQSIQFGEAEIMSQNYRKVQLSFISILLAFINAQPIGAADIKVDVTPTWLFVDAQEVEVKSMVLRVSGPDGERLAEIRSQETTLDWPLPIDMPDGVYSYEIFVQSPNSEFARTREYQAQPTGNLATNTIRGHFGVWGDAVRNRRMTDSE